MHMNAAWQSLCVHYKSFCTANIHRKFCTPS